MRMNLGTRLRPRTSFVTSGRLECASASSRSRSPQRKLRRDGTSGRTGGMSGVPRIIHP